MFSIKMAYRPLATVAVVLMLALTLLFHAPATHAHEGHVHDSTRSRTAAHSQTATTATAQPADTAVVYAETATDLFEVVVSRQDRALWIWLDDYATGKPVERAQVTVELNGKTQNALPQAQAGEYRIDDAAWVSALSQPSPQSLLLTVTAGNQSDLLTLQWNGTSAALQSGETSVSHAGFQQHRTGFMDAGLPWLLLLVGVAVGWFASRLSGKHSQSRTLGGLFALSLFCWVHAPMTAWAGPGAHGPNGEHLDDAPAGATDRPALLADGTLWLPKRSAHLMDVRTTVVQSGEFGRRVTLNGQIKASPDSAGLVQAPFPGRLVAAAQGFPVLGQRVRKGEVLMLLQPLTNSFAMSQAAAQLSDVQARLEAARRRAQRLEGAEGIVSQRDLDDARAERDSLEGRLKALMRSVNAETALTAPMDGVVSALPVLAGQVVDTSATLIEVLDPARLQFEARLSDLSLLGQIQAARLKEWPDARLRYLGSGRRWEDGSVPVRFAVNRPTVPLADIAVGQPVTLFVELNESTTGVQVASAAVVAAREGGNAVWVKTAAQRYRLQSVRTQVLDGQQVLVTAGLQAGDRVVVSGAQLLSGIR